MAYEITYYHSMYVCLISHYFVKPWTLALVNIGSGNGLLPDGAKPLPEPMLQEMSHFEWHYVVKKNMRNHW